MDKHNFDDLVALMARLRAPDGCPWDQAQDARSLRTYLLEETYEVLDAIEENDSEALKEELGDLLLQVVFHAQIAQEEGSFTLEDVLTQLHQKLVRRHPHVFGTANAETPDEVKANWDALKAAEKKEKNNGNDVPHLNAVSRHQPALPEAYQLTRRAAQVGFDWEKIEDVLQKMREETGELRAAIAGDNKENIEDEAGDLLFSAVNVVRFLGLDPEIALRRTNKKFIARFEQIEQALAKQGKTLREASLAELDVLWDKSKETP